MSSQSLMDKKMIEEIEKEYQQKIQKTMKRIETRIQKYLRKIISEYMLSDYYEGYKPKMYVRINQLKKSVGPYTNTKPDGDFITLTFGVSDLEEHGYGASQMDHSMYKLNIIYKRKKSGGTWQKTYDYYDEDVNEQDILDNFLAGIHPNVGNANTHPDIERRVNEALDYFITFELDHIIEEEIAKME